jgi:methanogenic corrinoid protein MtbC1
MRSLGGLFTACQGCDCVYPQQTMYTIKEAAARTGIPIALLRAWERRYRIVEPVRTAAGYRLYDDAALDRLRTMRGLIADGWQPSAAAAAILAGTAPVALEAPRAGGPVEPGMRPAAAGVEVELPVSAAAGRIDGFVEAAAELDAARLERLLDEMFAGGSFEQVADLEVLPALRAVGEAWARGDVTVSGEHAASQAVQRRIAAAFQAAGNAAPMEGVVLVGLPPGARHELGALAFAVAARRAGVPVLFLGADLPSADWVETAARTRARAAVIGSPTSADVGPAVAVAVALRDVEPHVVLAFGGRAAARAASRLAATSSHTDRGSGLATPSDGGRGPRRERRGGATALPDSLIDAVNTLRDAIQRRAASGGETPSS